MRAKLRFLAFAVLPLLVCLACVNYTEPNEAGIAWNRVTGALWLQDGGFHVTAPWVAVSTVDTRPMRVCLTSASKAFACKLVQFVPAEFKAFVAVEGHRYYWLSNRISFNSGYETYRGVRDVLRGHAFGATKYAFLTVLEET